MEMETNDKMEDEKKKLNSVIQKDNEDEQKAIADLKKELGLGEKDVLFAHSPFRISNADEVFVLCEADIGNGEKDTVWVRRKKDELKPDEAPIKCIIEGCNEPAYQIDHCCPMEMHETRCLKHRRSHIDEELYNQLGIAKVVCADHYEMLRLRSGMVRWADRLEPEVYANPNDTTTKYLVRLLRRTLQFMDWYRLKKWPEEMTLKQNETSKGEQG